MKNFRLNNNHLRMISFCLLILSLIPNGYSQDTKAKTSVIIDSLKLVEVEKMDLVEYTLKRLKYEATGEDSIKLIELENKLTDIEIRNRIEKKFEKVFTNREIDDIYQFVISTAFYKFMNSSQDMLSTQFADVNSELEKISKNIEKKYDIDIEYKFKPIPTEKEDGFYATVNYSPYISDEELILEDSPSITKKNIKDAILDTNHYGDKYIAIEFDKEGAKKFYKLTKGNIGKPIAIVINKYIVSLPKVLSEISGGKASISGNFTDEEIGDMIFRLKEQTK